jgi:hypothetical protein
VTLQITVAAPFRNTRKTAMRKNELIYYYAFDRKWLSKDKAAELLDRATEEGLVTLDNGVYTIAFDPATVTIPLGFKPGSEIFERHDPAGTLIARIAQARGVPDTEIVSEMNRIIKEQFDGNLLPPAALAILAKRYAVPYDDLHEALIDLVR